MQYFMLHKTLESFFFVCFVSTPVDFSLCCRLSLYFYYSDKNHGMQPIDEKKRRHIFFRRAIIFHIFPRNVVWIDDTNKQGKMKFVAEILLSP
jgi:hypothetical protein